MRAGDPDASRCHGPGPGNYLVRLCRPVGGGLQLTLAHLDSDGLGVRICRVNRVAQVHQEPVTVPSQTFLDVGV